MMLSLMEQQSWGFWTWQLFVVDFGLRFFLWLLASLCTRSLISIHTYIHIYIHRHLHLRFAFKVSVTCNDSYRKISLWVQNCRSSSSAHATRVENTRSLSLWGIMMAGSTSFNTSEEEKQTREPFNKTSLSFESREFTFYWVQSQVVTRANRP